jgi:hypothetical protein
MDVFLLGAGASAPLGLPTTRGFLKDFEPETEEQEALFHQICQLFSASPETIDIEAIFYSLENLIACSSGELKSFFNSGKVRQAFSYAPQVFNAQGFSHPWTPTNLEKGFASILKGLSQTAKELQISIKRYVLQVLSSFDPENAFELFFPVFEPFISRKKPLIIFTTNYDIVLEKAFCPDGFLAKKWKALGVRAFYFGFEARDLITVFHLNLKKVLKPGIVSLLKLHGSITWRLYKDFVIHAWKDVPFDPDSPSLIYPGYKGVPDREPFISLHLAFLHCLAKANRLISIGFAFRDPYIHALLHHALSLNSSLKVYALVPEFPEDSFFPELEQAFPGRVIHLPGKLGETSLREALAQAENKPPSPVEEATTQT